MESIKSLVNSEINFNGELFRQKFFEYLDVASEQTIKTYYNGITSFLLYIKENQISNPNRENVIAWKVQLKERTSASTVNTWLVGVKRFFKFLSLYRLYPNISEDVKGYNISVTPKKNILTEEQIKSIYHNLEKDNTLQGKRNKALFSLLITTGLRGIEVANARIQDLREVNGEVCLFVKGKGHTEYDDYVKIADNVYQNLIDYIGERQDGYIFISQSNHNRDGQITTKTIRLVFKKILKENDINDDTISLHGTRRTFACESYKLGQSIYDIQQVLRHRSIMTTQRYLKEADRHNNHSENLVASIL